MSHEMREWGNNEAFLRQAAITTGGRFNPAPRQVFDVGGRSIRSTMELWPGLLALAIALSPTARASSTSRISGSTLMATAKASRTTMPLEYVLTGWLIKSPISAKASIAW